MLTSSRAYRIAFNPLELWYRVIKSRLSQMIRTDCAASVRVLSMPGNFGQLSHHNFLSRMPSLPIAGQALVFSPENKAI
jgi:hypothetical protein